MTPTNHYTFPEQLPHLSSFDGEFTLEYQPSPAVAFEAPVSYLEESARYHANMARFYVCMGKVATQFADPTQQDAILATLENLSSKEHA
jgi:hypothetical protein